MNEDGAKKDNAPPRAAAAEAGSSVSQSPRILRPPGVEEEDRPRGGGREVQYAGIHSQGGCVEDNQMVPVDLNNEEHVVRVGVVLSRTPS